MKKILALLLIAATLSATAACGSSTEEAASETTSETAEETTEGESSGTEVFKIGMYQPLSGGTATFGQEAKNAAELACEYINENGGFNGVPGEVVTYDTTGSVEEAVKIVEKLLTDEKVDAVIGSVVSSDTFAAGKAVNDAGVYSLAMGNSANLMAEDWPYMFRAVVNYDYVVPKAVDQLQELGYESVAVFHGQDDAALNAANIFTATCEEKGVSVLATESFDLGDTDFSAQAANLINADPDCIFLSTMAEAFPVITKQLRQFGYNGMIFNKEGVSTAHIEVAGVENIDYVAFTYPYVPYPSVDDIDIPIVKEFCERYQEKYGDINQTDCAYRAWDTMMVIWEASKIAGANDSDSLRDATHKITGLEGLGGTMDFTAGDREGYSQEVNSFVMLDGKAVLWKDWLADGGYEDFLSKTGREK